MAYHFAKTVSIAHQMLVGKKNADEYLVLGWKKSARLHLLGLLWFLPWSLNKAQYTFALTRQYVLVYVAKQHMLQCFYLSLYNAARRGEVEAALPSNICRSAQHLLGLLWSKSIYTRLALVLALVVEQGKSFFVQGQHLTVPSNVCCRPQQHILQHRLLSNICCSALA